MSVGRRVAALLAILAAGASAQSAGLRTYANPIDIEYQYTWEGLNQRVYIARAPTPR